MVKKYLFCYKTLFLVHLSKKKIMLETNYKLNDLVKKNHGSTLGTEV